MIVGSGICLRSLIFTLLFVCIVGPAAADTDGEILQLITPQFEFRHPGGLNSLAELQRIRNNIVAGKEPWKSNLVKLQASWLARSNYVPHPLVDVNFATPREADLEYTDAEAAYAQALLWVFTNDPTHAQKAAEIIDAWSATVKTHTGMSWYLQSAWTPSIEAEAAEILRATYPQWQGATRFGKVLNDVYLPNLHNRMAFGNREFAVCNALVAIGVYNNDPAAFYEGISHWLSYVPSYFYVQGDGPQPKKPTYWLTSPSDEFLKTLDAQRLPPDWTSWIDLAKNVKNQGDDRTMLTKLAVDEQWKHPGAYIAGYTPETGGRDLGHTEGAFQQATYVAEIAWHQGLDLYSVIAPRLAVFMETMAAIRLGEPISPAAYGGTLDPGNGITPTYEIAYNHLHNVMGIELPKTRQLIETVIRQMGPTLFDRPFPPQFPASIRANRIWNQAIVTTNWETLTHADLDQKK
jgi:hypothetical protein